MATPGLSLVWAESCAERGQAPCCAKTVHEQMNTYLNALEVLTFGPALEVRVRWVARAAPPQQVHSKFRKEILS